MKRNDDLVTEIREYMLQKIRDFHVIVMMWNVTWAYLKSLAPGSAGVDYINYGNEWTELILSL